MILHRQKINQEAIFGQLFLSRHKMTERVAYLWNSHMQDDRLSISVFYSQIMTLLTLLATNELICGSSSRSLWTVPEENSDVIIHFFLIDRRHSLNIKVRNHIKFCSHLRPNPVIIIFKQSIYDFCFFELWKFFSIFTRIFYCTTRQTEKALNRPMNPALKSNLLCRGLLRLIKIVPIVKIFKKDKSV